MSSNDKDRLSKLREEANILRKKEQARRMRTRAITQISVVGGAMAIIAAIPLTVLLPQYH